ncbi:MAG: hypothetical protein DIU74_005100 [Pseudomonadota bacterium]
MVDAMIWSNGLSLLVWAVAAMLLLYAARSSMHALIRSVAQAITRAARATVRWLGVTVRALRARNRTVLYAWAREEASRRIEREFERVTTVVMRDLSGFPDLRRKLLEEIERLEADYKQCGEEPPPAPQWVEAVAAVSQVNSGHEVVQKVLKEIDALIIELHDRAKREYRRAYRSRHRILGACIPFWREVERNVARIDTKLETLRETLSALDAHMDRYRDIDARADKIEQALASSAFARFFVALAVMAAGAGAAYFHYELLMLPLAGTAALAFPQAAAWTIVALELCMGLFVLESLRITRLFPDVTRLDTAMRRRLLLLSSTALVILAAVSVALVWMRIDMLGNAPAAGLDAMPLVQFLLAGLLPFAMALLALALEPFVRCGRTVGGVVVLAALRTAAFLLRVIAQFAQHLSEVLIRFYDVLIVLPLTVERLSRRTGARESKARPVALEVKEPSRAS